MACDIMGYCSMVFSAPWRFGCLMDGAFPTRSYVVLARRSTYNYPVSFGSFQKSEALIYSKNRRALTTRSRTKLTPNLYNQTCCWRFDPFSCSQLQCFHPLAHEVENSLGLLCLTLLLMIKVLRDPHIPKRLRAVSLRRGLINQ